MTTHPHHPSHNVSFRPSRRAFLADVGMGFTGMALGAMLQRDGICRAESQDGWSLPTGVPHHTPKAKSVIWIFLIGGLSHMESFDPKPALNEYADKPIGETPYKDVCDSPLVKKNVRQIVGDHDKSVKIFPMQNGSARHGECGMEFNNWWKCVGESADDLAVVRSLWTTDNNHGAQLQFHTGRHFLDGLAPTIGSWVHYGLGTLNENLPQFIVLGRPIADCCGGHGGHGSDYLGPEHSGIQLNVDPKNPLPFATPGSDIYREEQQREFELLNRLNGLAAVEYPDDAAIRARIKSYELAFHMQTAVPNLVNFNVETEHTRRLYGFENDASRPLAEQCLAARRLVEEGVRFVQIFHGGNGGAGMWDTHSGLKKTQETLSTQVDQPIGALIKDLKQRGMLDDTLVVIGTEFGRTPFAQNADGRDHHPYGFSIVMAGGGLKRGIVHGKTDELGYHAIENRHYITDVHATVLHQMGIDPRKLDIPGRKRLEIDYGKPIHEIIA